MKIKDASISYGRVPLPTPFTSESIPRLPPLENHTPSHFSFLLYVRVRVERYQRESQRCRTTFSLTTLSLTRTPSPFLMPRNPNTLARSRIFNRTHGPPRLNLLHLQRNDRGQMAAEDGNIPQRVAGVVDSYRKTKRGRTVSTRTCRISRSRAMGSMECTLRDLSPLGTRISPLPLPRT